MPNRTAPYTWRADGAVLMGKRRPYPVGEPTRAHPSQEEPLPLAWRQYWEDFERGQTVSAMQARDEQRLAEARRLAARAR